MFPPQSQSSNKRQRFQVLVGVAPYEELTRAGKERLLGMLEQAQAASAQVNGYEARAEFRYFAFDVEQAGRDVCERLAEIADVAEVYFGVGTYRGLPEYFFYTRYWYEAQADSVDFEEGDTLCAVAAKPWLVL